ncbi:hypothetical protein C8035_v005996 [Colletotrichum spinosum]|uniref:FAD-binding domain-containing protein n=1 Tax=Colletotrichum spinosum TaxID=1347390 RepID=A0A4R8QBX0_9PEZI|nr:hypothetical protein C8035_v005996 [Colletotrichum spinosum]
MPSGLEKVIIVGAGPAGQLLGLLLGRDGIPVTIIGQDDARAWVDVAEAQTGRQGARLEADYVVGCDGANSIV